MRIFPALARLSLLAAIAALSACATSEPQTYLSRQSEPLNLAEAPDITQLLVKKADRKLYLLNGDSVVRSYDIDLGFAPVGHKTQQGDGKTPEGLYKIDRRNEQSRFYRSIGISYPGPADLAQARARGVNPGGDIFIHGEAGWASRSGTDWTIGCIALPDDQMSEIFALVDVGTPIMITP